MAIVIAGKTECGICKKKIMDGDEVVAFPPFVQNQADPLWKFNDAAFHATCFWNDPLASQALERLKEIQEKNREKICVVCGKQITNPDDYLTFGYLTGDKHDPLYPYNLLQFHRSHLAGWTDLAQAFDLLKDYKEAGRWIGNGLDVILTEIKPYLVRDVNNG